MADIAAKIDELERWRDGNGKPGAAAKLADHEKRISTAESKISEHDRCLKGLEIHQAGERLAMQEAVESVLRKRGRSLEGVIRAFGPYAAALGAIISAWLTSGGK